MKNSRPQKDEYYLNIAREVSARSPCIRVKYGAIIVKNDAIVSTGYNGPIRGGVNCYEVGGCIKNILDLPHGKSYDLCPAVHAEENCVINASRIGTSVLGGTLYLYGLDPETNKTVYSEPCDRCKRAIINSGIKTVITVNEGNMIQIFDVRDWIRKDTDNYITNLEKAKKGRLRSV